MAIPRRHRLADYLTVPVRLALALSFLFSLADRFGVLGPPGSPGVSWGNFHNFLVYNDHLTCFAPRAVRPALGVGATILEGLFGAALLEGVCTRLAAAAAAGLLFLFGAAMAISFGIKSPFDYSVFSAMGGALLLAAWGEYPLSADDLFDRLMNGRQTDDAGRPLPGFFRREHDEHEQRSDERDPNPSSGRPGGAGLRTGAPPADWCG